MNIKMPSGNLGARIQSGIFMFASAVLLISLGGFFYTVALIFLACFCTAEFFLIIAPSQKHSPKINHIIIRGVLWITIPIISLLIMREFLHQGMLICFWFFITIAIVDTFAYFTGKLIGKHKIAANISPSKTIEGFVGGILSATLFSILFYYAFKANISLILFIAISFILAILAQVSDLIESRFKRKFNIKDSSNIIPGHGGFLDRLDGYSLTAPFVVVVFYIIKYTLGVNIFG